jgi:hypothetical protein
MFQIVQDDLIVKDCRNFESADALNLPVDICFLDCAHNLEINKECISRFMPSMSDAGIIAFHDTGAWTKAAFDAAPLEYKNTDTGKWLEERYQTHAIWPAVAEERRTINWMLDAYPEYSQIHFHSTTYFRHGITLLQKTMKL